MKKSVLFCAAEFKRSWLNDPGRAMVAVSSARLVAQIPSVIRHTAIERPSWILFVNTRLPLRHESHTEPMDVFLTSLAFNKNRRLSSGEELPIRSRPASGHYAVSSANAVAQRPATVSPRWGAYVPAAPACKSGQACSDTGLRRYGFGDQYAQQEGHQEGVRSAPTPAFPDARTWRNSHRQLIFPDDSESASFDLALDRHRRRR